MSWQVITANESVCVDMPFEVVESRRTAHTERLDTTHQPRPERVFSFAYGAPMNRNEADLVLRHYTHEYAARVPAWDEDDASIARLTRELSYYIDATLSTGYVEWIVHFCRKANTDPDAESDINAEVNAALDAANIRGPHILRYTTQETHA